MRERGVTGLRDAPLYDAPQKFAPLNADFPYERYRAEASRGGIADVLPMEVDVAEADIENETYNVESLIRHEGGLDDRDLWRSQSEADFVGEGTHHRP